MCYLYDFLFELTHWDRVTHICIGNLTIIGSDNGLLPGQCQAIIWTNDGILLIGPLGTKFGGNLIKIYITSFKKMQLKMLFENRRPLRIKTFCLSLNVLTPPPPPPPPPKKKKKKFYARIAVMVSGQNSNRQEIWHVQNGYWTLDPSPNEWINKSTNERMYHCLGWKKSEL